MVGGRRDVLARYEYIVLFTSSGKHAIESFSIFESFDSIDAEHGHAQLHVQFTELRITQTGRTVFDHAGDGSANGVAFSLHLTDQRFHLTGFLLVGTSNDVHLRQGEVVFPIILIERDVPYL